MADEIIKIQELPETNTIGDSDVLPIVQGGVTYKIPVSVMRNDVAENTVENVEYVDGTLTVTKDGTETDLFNAEELKTDLDLTKADVGLGNVDNTSDIAKPISTATQAALNAKQNVLTFDDAPVSGSSNPVKSSGIYTALAGKKNTQTAKNSPSAAGNSLSFIDTISQDTQGVITATKKNVPVDSVPTEGSNNPVKSGGVYSAVSDLNQALTSVENTVISPIETSASGNSTFYIKIPTLLLGNTYLFIFTVKTAGSYTIKFGTDPGNDYMIDTLTTDHSFVANVPVRFMYSPSANGIDYIRLSSNTVEWSVSFYQVINSNDLKNEIDNRKIISGKYWKNNNNKRYGKGT